MTKETRLRGQDFGNFQNRERMRIEKAVRLLYGRFVYLVPNGESAADVYDGITGFRETLRAGIDHGRFQPPGQRSQNVNVVILSHGLIEINLTFRSYISASAASRGFITNMRVPSATAHQQAAKHNRMSNQSHFVNSSA